MRKKRIPKHLIIEPYPKPKSRFLIRFLMVLAIGLSGLATAFIVRADAADYPQAGSITFIANGANQAQALHLNTHVDASIHGLLVDVTYRQQFTNPGSQWMEGIYTFPLPENAAVQHMEIRVGERTIVGDIKPRAEAKHIYQQAIKQGKRAALTEQQRPNLFTQRIGNIPPGEEIEVVIKFMDVARYQRGTFSWRLPTTLTPRYIPGIAMLPDEDNQTEDRLSATSGWATATDQVPDAPFISPPFILSQSGKHNPLSINIALQSGLQLATVDALYHELAVTKQEDSFAIALQDDQSEMDRDFVLQWSPVTNSEPAAALFQQTMGNEHFSMLMLMPPVTDATETLARDITFIIDISGSMQGQSIVQAKASLAFAIRHLDEDDRFNIIAFNDNNTALFASAQQAGQSTKQRALSWVSALQADGGTEMAPALHRAFSQTMSETRLQQVVFITDGAIGNENALFSLIHQHAGNARLFTVGIGSAPNSFFMRKAAQFGRGSYEYIASPHEVERQMNKLFAKLNQSVAKNIAIAWPDDAEVYPAQSPDLYANEPILSFALTSSPLTDITVAGDTASHHWQKHVKQPPSHNTVGISARWARQKIAALEDAGTTGHLNPHEVKDAVTEVALRHHLLSRFTSFVAVDNQVVRNDGDIIPPLIAPVPNQLPQGSTHRQLAYPQTATNAELTLWLGGLCLIAGLALLRFQRRQVR